MSAWLPEEFRPLRLAPESLYSLVAAFSFTSPPDPLLHEAFPPSDHCSTTLLTVSSLTLHIQAPLPGMVLGHPRTTFSPTSELRFGG